MHRGATYPTAPQSCDGRMPCDEILAKFWDAAELAASSSAHSLPMLLWGLATGWQSAGFFWLDLGTSEAYSTRIIIPLPSTCAVGERRSKRSSAATAVRPERYQHLHE